MHWNSPPNSQILIERSAEQETATNSLFKPFMMPQIACLTHPGTFQSCRKLCLAQHLCVPSACARNRPTRSPTPEQRVFATSRSSSTQNHLDLRIFTARSEHAEDGMENDAYDGRSADTVPLSSMMISDSPMTSEGKTLWWSRNPL